MSRYTTEEENEEFESWLDQQLTGKYATGNLETELRMAVSQIRDMPELMPKDYAVQPLMRLIDLQTKLEVQKAQLAVASNAKLYTNKHGATYIVFETEDRDVSQNELKAILHSSLNQMNKINTKLTLGLSNEKDL